MARRRGWWLLLVAGVLVVVASLVVAGLGGLFGPRSDRQSSVGGSTPGSTTSAPSRPVPPAAELPAVLASAAAGPSESNAALGKRVTGIDRSKVGGRWYASVVDADSGQALFGHDPSASAVPASTLKLLTSTAALQLLGPEHRFQTRVVQGPGSQVVLVGGGDPSLASRPAVSGAYPVRPQLATLASATATALKQAGTRTVALGYDDSLFAGPRWLPQWPASYADQVTPVSALEVDEGRVSGFSPGPRVKEPAKAAATAFAKALSQQGITVSATTPARAPAAAPALASLDSLPLSDIVEQMLLKSDNDAAEMLLRQVALATQRPATFAGGVAAVQATLQGLGIWQAGTKLSDGSGLSRDNRASADQLTAIVRAAMSPDTPQLRPVLTGLPTAAVDGSLRQRFGESGSEAARGLLRAKTGTLTKVRSLAGYVLTRDGTLVVFAFVVNDLRNDPEAVEWLDHVTATVAGCGCRS